MNSLEERYFLFPDIKHPKFFEITKEDLNKGADLTEEFGLVVCYWELGKDHVRVAALEIGDDGQWTRHHMTYDTEVSKLKGENRYYIPILEYMIGMFEKFALSQGKATRH